MKINFSSLLLLIIIKLSFIHSYNTDINPNSFVEELNNDNDTQGKRLLYESYKYYNNSILFNTPRNNNSINYTLAIYNKSSNTYQPFPNEEFNDYDKNIQTCRNFISVVSFEIDDKDHIYALDEGSENCSAILYLLNIGDEIISDFYDTQIFVKKENIILNDFVVDKKNNYTYIIYTKTSSEKENITESIYSYGIIGIDLEENKTKNKIINIKFDEKYSIPEDLKNNLNYILPNFEKKSISISLSCDSKALFICPLESRKIYSISTINIRNNEEIISINEAYKNDATASIIASNMGNLFFVGIEQKLLYLSAQINNDLSGFDYRSFDKFRIEENISFISKISLANGVFYLTDKKIDEDGVKTKLIEIKFEENNTYEKSYIYRCQGLNYNYGWNTYIFWIIFVIIVVIIGVFVIVENQQDLDNYINKKTN